MRESDRRIHGFADFFKRDPVPDTKQMRERQKAKRVFELNLITIIIKKKKKGFVLLQLSLLSTKFNR